MLFKVQKTRLKYGNSIRSILIIIQVGQVTFIIVGQPTLNFPYLLYKHYLLHP